MLGRTAQQRVRPAEDFHFILEFTDPAFGLAQFSGLGRGDTRDLAAVDPVLLDPPMQAGRGDAEIGRGLRYGLTGSH